MLSRLRHRAQQTTASLPLYKAVPAGTARTYAALHYHASNSSPDEIVAYLDDHARQLPTQRYSASWIAASAAFAVGRDEVAETLLRSLSSRFPDMADPEVLWSQLLLFRGDYPAALVRAKRAELLDPASPTAAAQALRLRYDTHQPDADDAAIGALARLPDAPAVVWNACKYCSSEAQYRRIATTWLDALVEPDPAALEPRLQNLATAAARAGLLDSAVDLYAQAALLRLDGVNPGRRVREKRLAGKGAWSAVDDVAEVLDGAGVPYFLAAGTALGMVRAQGPLGHDSDIDVGVMEDVWDHDALVTAFLAHPRFDIDVAHPQHDKIYLKHRRGSSLDIWRFYTADGKVWHDGLMTRWGNAPFDIARRDVQGRSVPLPADADTYLTESYGDWRTPNADFDAFCDAPNVEVTWPDYQRFHRVRRAYRYLTANQVGNAVTQLRHAEELLLTTPSGRRLAQRLHL